MVKRKNIEYVANGAQKVWWGMRGSSIISVMSVGKWWDALEHKEAEQSGFLVKSILLSQSQKLDSCKLTSRQEIPRVSWKETRKYSVQKRTRKCIELKVWSLELQVICLPCSHDHEQCQWCIFVWSQEDSSHL